MNPTPPIEQHYQEVIEDALRIWLTGGDPTTTALVKILIEKAVKPLIEEAK